MGKTEYIWSETVRYGQLPKEERKVINKVVDKNLLAGGFDHTSVCTGEIAAMLTCFETHEWDTKDCIKEIGIMNACVDKHKYDPDPKLLVGRWQKAMRQRVFTHFVKQKVMPRLR